MIIFALPLILQVAVITSSISSYTASSTYETPIYKFEGLFQISQFFAIAVFFGWIWSIVIGLQRELPDNLKIKIARFKVFLFVPMIFIVAIYAFVIFQLDNFLTSNTGFALLIFGVFILVCVFIIICVLRSIYVAAKVLKTVELQRECAFGDFSGEFFMIVFFPIGIWNIQGRNNRIEAELWPKTAAQ